MNKSQIVLPKTDSLTQLQELAAAASFLHWQMNFCESAPLDICDIQNTLETYKQYLDRNKKDAQFDTTVILWRP